MIKNKQKVMKELVKLALAHLKDNETYILYMERSFRKLLKVADSYIVNTGKGTIDENQRLIGRLFAVPCYARRFHIGKLLRGPTGKRRG